MMFVCFHFINLFKGLYNANFLTTKFSQSVIKHVECYSEIILKNLFITKLLRALEIIKQAVLLTKGTTVLADKHPF